MNAAVQPAAAGSGLLLPTLDDLIAETGRRSGVLAVLDAADKAQRRFDNAMYLASFAPQPIYSAFCPCGAVAEIRPADGRTQLSDEDYEFIRDFDDAHSYCEAAS